MSRNFTAILSAIVFSALVFTTATTRAEHHEHKHTTSKADTSLESLAKKPKTTLKVAKGDTIVYVGDLHCKHCAKSLTSKLVTVKGVKSVRADIKADVAVITPQSKKKLDPKALWAAAKKSGFPAIKLVGPNGTYVLDAKTKEPKLMPKAEKELAPKAETAKS